MDKVKAFRKTKLPTKNSWEFLKNGWEFFENFKVWHTLIGRVFCKECRYQIRLDTVPSPSAIWWLYQVGKQTVSESSAACGEHRRAWQPNQGRRPGGMQSLFRELGAYPLQMCHFHIREIIKRYITRNPKLLALKGVAGTSRPLPRIDKAEFEYEYALWKETWKAAISRRSMLKSGKTRFTHRKEPAGSSSVGFSWHWQNL